MAYNMSMQGFFTLPVEGCGMETLYPSNRHRLCIAKTDTLENRRIHTNTAPGFPPRCSPETSTIFTQRPQRTPASSASSLSPHGSSVALLAQLQSFSRFGGSSADGAANSRALIDGCRGVVQPILAAIAEIPAVVGRASKIPAGNVDCTTYKIPLNARVCRADPRGPTSSRGSSQAED